MKHTQGLFVLWNKKEVVPAVIPWRQEEGSPHKPGQQVTLKEEESVCIAWDKHSRVWEFETVRGCWVSVLLKAAVHFFFSLKYGRNHRRTVQSLYLYCFFRSWFNCNLLPEASACNSSYRTNIFDIYGLSQLITEPTRVTPPSKTLIDLCITNSPEKVTNSCVIHLGISDHSLAFMTRKVHHDCSCPRRIEMRQKSNFLSDLEQMPWSNVDLICVLIEMTCGKNGNKCLLAAWTNTHHAN